MAGPCAGELIGPLRRRTSARHRSASLAGYSASCADGGARRRLVFRLWCITTGGRSAAIRTRLVIRIVARDQIEEMRRNGESEFIAGEQHPAALLLAKIDMLLELGQRRDPIFELPFPIIPEFRRHIRPVSGRM